MAELRARARAEQAILSITGKIHTSSDYGGVIEGAMDAFARFTYGASLALYSLDEPMQRLELLSARGLPGQSVAAGFWLPLEHSLSGVAIARRAIVTSGELADDPAIAPVVRRDLVEDGYHAAVSVPLLLGSRAVGVINVMYKGKDRLDEYEQDMLIDVGRAIALALDGARHVARVEAEVAERRRAEVRLTLLLAFSREANESLSNIAALCEVLARHGAQLLRDACVVYAVTPDRESLEVKGSCDLSPDARDAPKPPIGSRVRLDKDGAAAQAVHTATTVFLPEGDPLRRSPCVHSLLCAPLVASGRVVGVVEVVRTSPQQPYTPEDKALVEGLAQSAALVVDNALLLEAVREAARAKHVFLAIAAHELKTPLTPLRLDADWLVRAVRAGKPPTLDKWAPRVAAVSRGVSRLEQLVEDLLQHANRRLELSRGPVDLGQLVADVCDRAAAQGAGTINVRIRSRAVGPWDAARVRQAIDKLVDNALKYGVGKPVDVTLDTEAGFAVVRVTDRGIGIDACDLRRVFDPFEHVAPARHYGGIGLGLWIARAVAEAHGGSIDVESRVGEGSTFTLRLPLDG